MRTQVGLQKALHIQDSVQKKSFQNILNFFFIEQPTSPLSQKLCVHGFYTKRNEVNSPAGTPLLYQMSKFCYFLEAELVVPQRYFSLHLTSSSLAHLLVPGKEKQGFRKKIELLKNSGF
jgi:hypothetical protein